MKVRVPGVDRLVYAIAELPKDQVAPRRPPAPGARRVGRRPGALGQPRRRCGRRPARRTSSPRRSTGRGLDGLLGTVAGDDTILVVAEEVDGGRARSPSASASSPALRTPMRPDRAAEHGAEQTRRDDERGKARRARVLGWARHLGGRPLAERGARLRGDRRRGRRRPGSRLRGGPRARALAAGAIEAVVVDARDGAGRGLRPARRCRRTPSTRASTRSSRRSPVRSSSRHLVAAARRHGAERGRPRLHRQGQRPGPLRGRDARARPGSRDRRPGPGVGDDPRGDRSTTPSAKGIPITATHGADLLDRREPLGPGDRVRRDRRPLGSRRPTTSTPSPSRPRTEPGRGRRSASRPGVPVASTARRSASSSSSPSSARSPARPGSAGSTSSRTAGSASRAARSTSAPAALALIAAHHGPRGPHPRARRRAREAPPRAPLVAELVYDGLWFSPLRRRSAPSSPRPSDT